MSMTSEVSVENKTVTIKIKGKFDFSLHSDFRKSYKDIKLDAGQYIVDLAFTDYIDSSALGMLLLLKEHADLQSAEVRIINYNDEVREILHIASFDKLFTLD